MKTIGNGSGLDKQNLGPCKTCLVASMCRKACEEFERYIFWLHSYRCLPGDTFFCLANDIRSGDVMLRLFDDGTVKWESVVTWEATEQVKNG